MRRGLLPYLLGGFFLVPLGIWAALWSTGLGGGKAGFEVPVANALFLVSVPLVLWFLVASLGSIANSMVGASEFQVPRFAPARWLLRLLPALTLMLGVVAGGYLLVVDGPRLAVLLPLGLALLFAVAIRTGEARRGLDAGEQAVMMPRRVRLRPLLELAGRAVTAIPLVGAMIADAVRGRHGARTYFAFNLALAWLAALWFFGPILILWTALALAPTMLVALVVLTASR